MTVPVEARSVTSIVGGNVLVDAVSLHARPGEFVGIVGPNGAGKTSLLRCLAALRRPTAGTVLLDGREVTRWPRKALARTLAFVQQENAADTDITVRDAVMLGRIPHKGVFDRDTASDHALVATALARVELQGWEGRRWHTLSGGEKQRVHLARAMVQEPEALLLDEPTNHLDVKFQLQMLAFIRSLGLTTIAVLHDLNLAALFCDRIVVMQSAKVVADGPPEDVLTPRLLLDVFEAEAEVVRHARTGRPSITYIRAADAEQVDRDR